LLANPRLRLVFLALAPGSGPCGSIVLLFAGEQDTSGGSDQRGENLPTTAGIAP
jgi:hypothetical protein